MNLISMEILISQGRKQILYRVFMKSSAENREFGKAEMELNINEP